MLGEEINDPRTHFRNTQKCRQAIFKKTFLKVQYFFGGGRKKNLCTLKMLTSKNNRLYLQKKMTNDFILVPTAWI